MEAGDAKATPASNSAPERRQRRGREIAGRAHCCRCANLAPRVKDYTQKPVKMRKPCGTEGVNAPDGD